MNKVTKFFYVAFMVIIFPLSWFYNIFTVAILESIKDFKDAIREDEE